MLPELELLSLANELFEAGVEEVTSLEAEGRSVRVFYRTEDSSYSGYDWAPKLNLPLLNCRLRRVSSYETEEIFHQPLVARLNQLLVG